MIARITSIENLITRDPGGRHIFELMLPDQLRLSAQSLRLARRVGIVSGFFVPEAGAAETDGPPGAKVLGDALIALGIEVDYITDSWCAAVFRAIGIEPLIEPVDYIAVSRPSHLVSVERLGRAIDGRYHNMHGLDVTDCTAPLDGLFLEARRRGLSTIGIGDGGNEIGMGRVFAATCANVAHGKQIASLVSTDFCIAAGVSNWGAYGLAGALSILAGRDLLPTPDQATEAVHAMVRDGGAVDGVTWRREPTVDGLALTESIRTLESIRAQIAPPPLADASPKCVGILGYGETGRAAARLLRRHGHHVLVSDGGSVEVESGLVLDGIETGKHTIDFLARCDLVVASPGVRSDHPIRGELHARAIPVISEVEMAYQLCDRDIIAVTGSVGKRATIEQLQQMFAAAGRELRIGGNRGVPLSELLLQDDNGEPLALAVSSFQLETIVGFRPRVAVILNLHEAHLDRHRSVAEYLRIKSRVFMNQGHTPSTDRTPRPTMHGGDLLVLPFDDERLRALSRKHHGRTLFVSSRQSVDRGAWIDGDSIMVNLDGDAARIPAGHAGWVDRASTLLPGIIAAQAYGIDADAIARALSRKPTTQVFP